MTLPVIKKASALERAANATIYPCYGFIKLEVADNGGFVTGTVEDLRGSWSRPDPVWELRAPKGYHFTSMTHGYLEHTLKGIRETAGFETVEKCTTNCGCGCEFD